MQSVGTFLGHLEARAAELSVDQLLLVLKSLQDFPDSEACPAVGRLLVAVSAVVTAWCQEKRIDSQRDVRTSNLQSCLWLLGLF